MTAVREDPASAWGERYKADPMTFVPLVAWFDQIARFDDRPIARTLIENSFGPFLAEQAFGYCITTPRGRTIPTRGLAEQLIIARNGFIPDLSAVLRRIRPAPWMHGATLIKSTKIPELVD